MGNLCLLWHGLGLVFDARINERWGHLQVTMRPKSLQFENFEEWTFELSFILMESIGWEHIFPERPSNGNRKSCATRLVVKSILFSISVDSELQHTSHTSTIHTSWRCGAWPVAKLRPEMEMGFTSHDQSAWEIPMQKKWSWKENFAQQFWWGIPICKSWKHPQASINSCGVQRWDHQSGPKILIPRKAWNEVGRKQCYDSSFMCFVVTLWL